MGSPLLVGSQQRMGGRHWTAMGHQVATASLQPTGLRQKRWGRWSPGIARHCVRRILLIGTATVLFLAVVDVFFFLCVTLSESGMNLQQPSGLALFLCLVLSTQTVVVGAVLYFMTRMPDVQRPKAVSLATSNSHIGWAARDGEEISRAGRTVGRMVGPIVGLSVGWLDSGAVGWLDG